VIECSQEVEIVGEVKQVIVIRKYYPDGKGGIKTLRRGKEIAQGCHASIAWLSEKVRHGSKLTKDEEAWIQGAFTKICVCVNSEEDLLEVYQKALDAGLTAKMITDAGRTEFDGIPTRTCLAIGPNKSEEIDKVTGELKLY